MLMMLYRLERSDGMRKRGSFYIALVGELCILAYHLPTSEPEWDRFRRVREINEGALPLYSSSPISQVRALEMDASQSMSRQQEPV